eukprot:2912572-Amphidinium_carterae.1
MQCPCETIKSDVPAYSMKNRKIQEHHNVDRERISIYDQRTEPLGLAYVPPRGRQLLQETEDDDQVKLMTRPRKRTETLCVIFDMVAELAIWQAELAIEFA